MLGVSVLSSGHEQPSDLRSCCYRGIGGNASANIFGHEYVRACYRAELGRPVHRSDKRTKVDYLWLVRAQISTRFPAL